MAEITSEEAIKILREADARGERRAWGRYETTSGAHCAAGVIVKALRGSNENYRYSYYHEAGEILGPHLRMVCEVENDKAPESWTFAQVADKIEDRLRRESEDLFHG